MFCVDPNFSKSKSGARFFSSIQKTLSNYPNYSQNKFSSVLCNISTPLSRFLIYKFLGRRISVRVDGIYAYPISKKSFKIFYPYLSNVILFIYKFKLIKTYFKNSTRSKILIFLFNLKFNYKNFFRIVLSNHVIYQSKFARELYINYFPNKKNTIINNSSSWKEDDLPMKKYTRNKTSENFINLCTDFHLNRPLKGFGDLMLQLKEIRSKSNGLEINLFIFGCIPNSQIKTFAKELIDFDKFINENKKWISTYPKFSEYEKKLSEKIMSCDAFISFAQYDPCPNILVEALSHGLPIIACNSGGVPEIVGDCGILLPVENQLDLDAFNLNFDNGVEPPLISEVNKSIISIKNSSKKYRLNVRNAILNRLSNKKACDSYFKIINN